jgi:predicted RND superfamily exporter protein
MDGSRLSPQEQQILARIENHLSQDERLERELRTLHLSGRTKCAEAIRRTLTALLTVLVLASGLLLVLVIRNPTAGPITAFTVTCTAALALSAAFLHTRTRRRRQP